MTCTPVRLPGGGAAIVRLQAKRDELQQRLAEEEASRLGWAWQRAEKLRHRLRALDERLAKVRADA